jgi:LacI family gluconate utilization system Gnt-I transcriptional repressor
VTETSGTPTRPTRRKTGTVTVHEVAALAGVSPSTVSRALRAPDQVSEAAYEAVMRAVAETHYVPNRAASNLASNRSGTVATVLPALTYSVFADIVHGLETVLADAGIQLFIGSAGYDPAREEEVLRALLGRRPDGVVLVGTTHTSSARALLEQSQVPVVETWDWTEEPVGSLVGFSHAAAFESVAEYIVERGYRSPTFVGWVSGSDARARARRDGFLAAMARLRPEITVPVVDAGERGIGLETGSWLLEEALRSHPETDVLVCASDIFATGAMLEAERRGLRVPDDLAITGFGDFELSARLNPGLTTVATPDLEIGRRAGELLLARIADPTLPAEVVDLGFQLIARGSA